MPSLPFVVAPTIRTRTVSVTIDDQNCSLEFPVYGALKGKELVAMREHEYQAAVTCQASRLADALVGEGTEEKEAQRVAIRVISIGMGIPVALEPAEHRLALRHAPLIADISCILKVAFDELKLRTITAIIAHRLPGCAEWSDDDTGELPGPLQEAIYAFATDEQTGAAPQRSPEELLDQMVDTLGKLGPASPQSPPTGPGSTGAAETSGPPPQSSPPSGSATSRSATSSRRSKRASAA